jgi:hypothetical protein
MASIETSRLTCFDCYDRKNKIVKMKPAIIVNKDTE